METRRLKNIVILILVLLNVFLAALLLNFRLQGARARRDMLEKLEVLFATNAISLSEDLELDVPPLSTLSVQRDLETEAEIAAMLMGETVPAEHQGGGIYSYTGARGAVHFRSGGNFDYVPDEQHLDDPQAFCQSFCETFGYEPTAALSGETGTFTAVQTLEGSAVYNCTVSFQFRSGDLISLAGTYASTASTASSQTSLTAVDALVQMLNYRNETGMVCNSIQRIVPVYELQSGPSAALQLAAKWQITADAYEYYVDCATGDIVRA